MKTELLEQIRTLIGQHCHYQGHSCTVVELLEPENALVLRCEDVQPDIQGNQFGEATRRAPVHRSVPILDEHGGVNPVIEGWLD